MIRSISNTSPVISLASSSTIASRRLQEFFVKVLNMKPLEIDCMSSRFDSVASTCRSSGTIIHFVSFLKSPYDHDEPCTLSLLAVTGGSTKSLEPAESVHQAQLLLERHMDQVGCKRWKASLTMALGGILTSSHILGKDMSQGGLPLFQISGSNNIHVNKDDGLADAVGGVREITLPHYDDAHYHDGSTLLSTLSLNPRLSRPVVGLYKYDNLTIRPLPAAQQDRSLPWPSLVFGCSDLEGVGESLLRHGAQCAKIGYNGTGKSGQLILRHDELFQGLDVRICNETMPYSSCFSEAQDALLASSLQELQSTDVMIEGSKGTSSPSQRIMDSMIGVGDCWVEFRANMKKPLEFLRRKPAASKPRTAKPPNLPYQ